MAPGWSQGAADRTSLVTASPGTPKPSQPHLGLGASPHHLPLSPGPQTPQHCQGLGVAQVCSPQDILAERWERVLLVMAEHLKHNWLALDVLDERFCHLHSNLEEKELLSTHSAVWLGKGTEPAAAPGVWKGVRLSVPCIPHPLLPPFRDALPTKTIAMKSQPFQVDDSSFWCFSCMSTMSKAGLAGRGSSQWPCRDPSSCRGKGVVGEGYAHFGHDRSPGVALVLCSSRVLLKRPRHGDG